jgi:hypothetical protein
VHHASLHHGLRISTSTLNDGNGSKRGAVCDRSAAPIIGPRRSTAEDNFEK